MYTILDEKVFSNFGDLFFLITQKDYHKQISILIECIRKYSLKIFKDSDLCPFPIKCKHFGEVEFDISSFFLFVAWIVSLFSLFSKKHQYFYILNLGGKICIHMADKKTN